LLILCISLFFGCEEKDIAQIDPDQTLGDPNSLYNQALAVDELSTFLDAAVSAGLALDMREGDDNLTIFAPSNEAFSNAGIDLNTIDQTTLESVMTYHVIPDSLPSGLLTSGRYPTNSGKFISITTENGVVIEPNNEAAEVINADIIGSNGVIHVINQLLIAPDELSQLVASNNDLSVLNQAIGRFPELVSAVEGLDSDLTVFAPTNAAFESFLSSFPQYSSLEDVPDHVLRTILEYHLVQGELFAAEVSGEINTLQGEALVATAVLEEVSTANVNASNGVAHVIDQVLVPPSVMQLAGSVLGAAYFDPEARFTTLVDAIELAGLRETLLTEGPFTIFAPTNDAFATSGIDLGAFSAEDPQLQALLLYHVITGSEVDAASLSEGPVTAANDADFYVNLTDMGNFVNASEIIVTDVQANNGIVHAIDQPLMPPPGTVVETALSDGNFDILLRALEIAGLTETLNQEGPYTVFAPTDDAFEALLSELGVESIDNLTAAELQPILLYHVTDKRIFSFQVNEGVEIETLNTGEDFIINQTVFPQPDDAPPLVEISIVQPGEDSELLSTDIVSTNGVIHVIDKVLLP
jgi:transforming growth factor-beta-induced protein